MKTYIDESGSFSHISSGNSSISCVAALTVPDCTRKDLFRAFGDLKNHWGLINSPKAGQLNESQILEVVDLLLQHHAFLHVAVTDTGMTNQNEISLYKNAQVEAIQRNLTDKHHPNLRTQLDEICQEIKALSFPNYIEYSLLTELIERVFRDMTLWYATHNARELADFGWTLDSKDKQPTKAERIWKVLVAAYLQTRFLQEPLICLQGANYSYLDKYLIRDNRPEHLPASILDLDEKDQFEGYDIGKIIRDKIKFRDDKNTLGLQLAHIVGNAYRRALVGNIEIDQIEEIGQLLMKSRRTAAILVMLRTDGMRRSDLEPNVGRRLMILERQASMRWRRIKGD